MSLLKTNGAQIGQSLTATNNFVWYQPGTPDGTIRLGNGNSGSTADIVVVTATDVSIKGTASSSAALKLYENTGNGTNYVALKSPASLAADVTWTLPSADGTSNQLIKTDGSSALSFTSIKTVGGASLIGSGDVGTITVAYGGTGATTLTGILKGNGTSAFTAATAGTDYLAPPSGTALLKANSGGALANATAGTDYLAPPSGTALLKANSGGALANATAGTDYVAPGTATSFTSTQTFSGSSSVLAAILTNAAEVCTVSATAATGTINYDVTTQSVLYYTTSASGNFTINLRASSGTTMNTALSTGQSLTVAFLCTNGGTAYYNSSVQVDGTTSGVTTKWQGGTAPTSGNASSVDVYTYTVIKTGSATFTVLASQTKFA